MFFFLRPKYPLSPLHAFAMPLPRLLIPSHSPVTAMIAKLIVPNKTSGTMVKVKKTAHTPQRQQHQHKGGKKAPGPRFPQGTLTNSTSRPLHHTVQLPAHDRHRQLRVCPRPDEAEFGGEVGAHGPGEEDAPAKGAQHRARRRRRARVQRQLVCVALLLDAALPVKEVVGAARVQRVVELIGREDAARGRRRRGRGAESLEELGGPEEDLELGQGGDGT